jgi:hypothetical protein
MIDVHGTRTHHVSRLAPGVSPQDSGAALGLMLALLRPAAREGLGRALADLYHGAGGRGREQLAGLASLQPASSPSALPSAGGGAMPPRLGGAASGNVMVRGQDGSAFPVRDSHVSSPAEAAWALDRARQLGLSGGNVSTQQYSGFYGIDYSQAGDNRIHTLGIGPDEGVSRINVGLVQELYRNMPREQADAILACDLRYIQEDARRRAASEA